MKVREDLIMKKIYMLVFGLMFLFSCEYSNVQYIEVDKVTNENIELAQNWIDNLLSNNLDDVKNSMHEGIYLCLHGNN